jgi:hypothetical protein
MGVGEKQRRGQGHGQGIWHMAWARSNIGYEAWAYGHVGMCEKH